METAHLLDSSSPSVEVPREKGRAQDRGGRNQGVVNLVQVTVLGLPVRLGRNDLGVKVELERRRHQLLFGPDTKRLLIVGSKLGNENGSNRPVGSQVTSREGFGKSVVLEDFAENDFENLLLPLVVLVTTIVQPVAVQVVDSQDIVQRRVGGEEFESSVVRRQELVVIMVMMTMVGVGDTRVFGSEKGHVLGSVVQCLLGMAAFNLDSLEQLGVPILVFVQQLPNGLFAIIVHHGPGVFNIVEDILNEIIGKLDSG